MMKAFLFLLGLCWLWYPYSGNAQTVSQTTSTSSVCDAAKIDELIQQGRSEKKAKDFDAAIITFKAVLACDLAQSALYEANRNLGVLHYQKQEFEIAMLHFENAEAIYPALPKLDQKYRGDIFSNKGKIFLRWGDYKQAINSFEAAFKYAKNSRKRVEAFINLGQTYRYLKDYPTAQSYYQQALDSVGRSNDFLRAFVLNGFAELAVEDQQYPEALRYYLEVKEIFGPYPVYVPQIQGNIAEIYRSLGQRSHANRAFKEAVTLGKASLDSTRELGKIYLGQAALYAQMGQATSALQSYQAALAQVLPDIDQADPYSFTEPDTFPAENVIMDALDGKAQIFRSLAGQSKDSLKYHQLALEHWLWALQSQSSLRANYQEHTSKYQLVNETRKLAEPAIDQTWWLWQHSQDPKYLRLGFQLSERNKASMMLELIRELDLRDFQALPLGERQQWDSLQQELAIIERELNVRQADNEQKKLKSQRFALKQSVLQLEKRWEKQYPAYHAAKNDLSTRSLQEIQSLLPPQKALLTYSVGGQQSYAFLVRSDTVIWTRLAIDSTINADILRFREALELGALTLDQQSYQLYQKVFAPLEGYLAETKSLLIIPDQGMALLPFEAMLTTMPGAGQKSFEKAYLLRKYAVGYAFSASLWAEMILPKAKANNPNILAVAPDFPYSEALLAMAQEPDYNPTRSCLDPIQNLAEIDSLAALSDIITLVGKQATRMQLLKQLEEYAFVHIATHAMADDEDPRKTFLVLREEGSELSLCGETYPDMTALYMNELLHHRIAAEMVVLAACQTGIGKYHHGEGLSSLARSFALAGANSVVASLWSVDDRSTRMMMPRFYHYLQEGYAKDVALQKAKIDVLEGGMGAPVYWSSFIVLGDTQAIEIPSKGFGKAWWALLLLIPMAIFGVRRSRRNAQ